METVIVIGGGAAGIMAALTAAEKPGRRVILLERQQRLGRKLLATGNGRCNLSNTGAAPEHYHGEQPGFEAAALEKFSAEDTLNFFHGLGLVTVEEHGGRVYPLSNSANSVLDVLRFALEKAGVELRCSCPARAVSRREKGYAVLTDEGELFADFLIVACGGAAGSKLGGVMDGYELLKPLGHKRTALRPALVQLITEPEYPRALKGVRADGEISLLAGVERLCSGAGEIQFTERGVSGPAAFDISRAAAVAGAGPVLSMNFFRNMGRAELLELLGKRRADYPGLDCAQLFTGMLHNRLGRMLVKYCGLSQELPLKGLSSGDLARCAGAAVDFRLKLLGTEGFDNAQVTAGGIKTGGFNPETLESWFMPGLFVCGELLDVDGDCGGYNLQWAWSSGRLAGRLGQ